jgi:hypothetical protein
MARYKRDTAFLHPKEKLVLILQKKELNSLDELSILTGIGVATLENWREERTRPNNKKLLEFCQKTGNLFTPYQLLRMPLNQFQELLQKSPKEKVILQNKQSPFPINSPGHWNLYHKLPNGKIRKNLLIIQKREVLLIVPTHGNRVSEYTLSLTQKEDKSLFTAIFSGPEHTITIQLFSPTMQGVINGSYKEKSFSVTTLFSSAFFCQEIKNIHKKNWFENIGFLTKDQLKKEIIGTIPRCFKSPVARFR